MGYIYCITNLINHRQYVGKTERTIELRWKEHIKEAFSRENNKHLYCSMRKYGIQNFKIEQLEECPDEQLSQKEQQWIERLNTFADGYNLTLGGEGKKEFNYEKIYKTYLKYADIQKTAQLCGCGKDCVRAACLSYGLDILSYYRDNNLKQFYTSVDGQRRYKKSDIAKKYQELQNVKDTAQYFHCDVKTVTNACEQYGVPILSSGESTRKKIGKPVLQINTKTGAVIASFPSATEAARQVYKDEQQSRNILGCCCGRQKTVKGFGWVFPENLDNLPDYNCHKRKKKVQQFSTKGEFIQTFDSGMDAARSLGGAENEGKYILKSAKENKIYLGYYWKIISS